MARFWALMVLLVPFIALSRVADAGWIDRAVYRKDDTSHREHMWFKVYGSMTSYLQKN